MWDFHIRHYSLPKLSANTVSIVLPAVFAKYVEGVPDLHRAGYEYQPYRDTVDFRYDVHNSFYNTRIGNDSDLIHFFRSSGPELEEALIACLNGAGSDMKINFLKAGSTLDGAGDQKFAKAVLGLAMDPDPQVRKAVPYVFENGKRGKLNIDTRGSLDPGLVRNMEEILQHGDATAQRVALPLLAALPANSPWTEQPEIVSAVRSLLERQPRVGNYAQVLSAAAAFPSLMREAPLRDRILAGLRDSDTEVQRAAMHVALGRFLDDPQSAPLVREAFAHLGNSQRGILIEEAAGKKVSRYSESKTPNLLENPVVFEAVLAGLQSPEANLRAAALDALRKVDGIERRPEFRTALERLQSDPNPRLQAVAKNVLAGKTLNEALADVKPGSVLDFNFFVAKVEPILAATGPDGKACVMCHATHVIFKLLPPNAEGTFSAQDSEQNYKYAMRVVDINNPAKSLILIKPTRPTDSAGNVDDYFATHNGGQRWLGNESSRQYKTILEWIRGARLQTPSQTQRPAD
jgi:hypothetical protein